MKLTNVYQVATNRLCIGCGACYYACPEKKIKLIDIADDGIRPLVEPGGCGGCDQCVKVCPGVNTILPAYHLTVLNEQLRKRWGNIIELWEGYAADPEIRFRGSSGGLCTALSLFCIEKGKASGVLHIGSDPDKPLKNKTFRSTTKEELIRRTGSRYSPASPCDGINLIDSSSELSIFIGKPCDVAGLGMTCAINPALNQKLFLVIGFFCAGTPSTLGTLDLMRGRHIDPNVISDMRYRGMGWPGNAAAWRNNNREPVIQISYKESWGFVQKYRPFRCYLCPDLTAEFADISVGDPWYREIGEDEPGRSLILIRNEKGREIFHQAIAEGYVVAEPIDPEIIYLSQKNLLGKRQAIWGRLLAMKMLGVPYPRLEGFHLFANWLDLPLKEKVKSFLGTVKRIVQRNYFKPLDYSSYQDE